MLSDTEGLLTALAGDGITYRGRRIDLRPPWPRVRVRDAFLQWAGWDPVEHWDADRFDLDMVSKVEPSLPQDRPCVLMDIYGIVSCEDALAARCVIGNSTPEFDKQIRTFVDHNGNNLLWYLTYRYDRNPPGGFACPFTVAALLDKGVNPNHLNNLGLCWNDVSKHVVRPEM